MRGLTIGIAALALSGLAGCVAPVGPVEVTRFHVPQAALGQGPIAVEPGEGMDAASLEYRAYAAAVARELVRVGYVEQAPGSATRQVALVRVQREAWRPERTGGPVSVGVGGSTGSYGSGVGLGIGVDLSGPPPEQVETRLAVVIKQRESGEALWEGRASFIVRASSPVAQTPLAAPKLAAALFGGFPGQSGETIQVK